MESCLQRKGWSGRACWSECEHPVGGREPAWLGAGGWQVAGQEATEARAEGRRSSQHPRALEGWRRDGGVGYILCLEESSGRSEGYRLEGQDGTSSREDTSAGTGQCGAD